VRGLSAFASHRSVSAALPTRGGRGAISAPEPAGFGISGRRDELARCFQVEARIV
jgi:hypothetical protein